MCGGYFGAPSYSDIITVVDTDLGVNTSTAMYCAMAGLKAPCSYIHYVNPGSMCAPPGAPDICHRYRKVTYTAECTPFLQGYSITSQLSQLTSNDGGEDGWDREGVLKACADFVVSKETYCYGPTGTPGVVQECDCEVVEAERKAEAESEGTGSLGDQLTDAVNDALNSGKDALNWGSEEVEEERNPVPSGSRKQVLGDRVSAHILEQRGMPLWEKDAIEQGWTRVGEKPCHEHFGRQYQKDGFLTPTLMFGENGHLAGMQFAVDTNVFPLFPDSNLKEGDLIVSTGLPHHQGDMALTSYFMDPTRVCDPEPPVEGSVGDRLWVLSPASPEGYEKIPLYEDEGLPQGYFGSGCAPSGFAFPGSPGMGTHYWKQEDFLPNGEPDAHGDCNKNGALFLMYSRGELVAFGLTFVGFGNRVPTTGGVMPSEIGGGRLAMTNGDIWEFARQPLDPFFFHPEHNPKCLVNLNRFNSSLPFGDVTTGTLHVFVKDPYNISCDGFSQDEIMNMPM